MFHLFFLFHFCISFPDRSLKRYRYVHGNWGAKQPYAGTDSEKTKLKKVLHAMHKYALHNVTAMPLQSRLACTNEENQCGFWAAMDECENNLQFMLQTCPLACQFCDERSLYERCKDQSSGLPWLQPTEMRTKLQQQWSKGGTLVHGSTSEEDSPWVLQFEHFLTDKEADAMVAKIQGLSSWNPSPVVAAARLDDNDPVRRNSRSLNEKDVKLYESIISKLSKLLGAPVRHFEYELVHYAKMQSFGVHHDFRPHDVWKPAGPRVISLILCLSDVTKGGAIGKFFRCFVLSITGRCKDPDRKGSIFPGFPDLDWLFIPPQKGQLIVWPNVLSSNLRKRRPIMSSEGLPVLEGEKYVLHAWVHLYDYEHATKQECA
jgi:hypothetical protein